MQEPSLVRYNNALKWLSTSFITSLLLLSSIAYGTEDKDADAKAAEDTETSTSVEEDVENFVKLLDQPEDWEQYLGHDPNSTKTIDHSYLEFILSRYSKKTAQGYRIDYEHISRGTTSSLHRDLIKKMLLKIKEYNLNQQIAYWVNLYNGSVLHWVLSHYPIDSIQDIQLSNDPYVHGPWLAKTLKVDGMMVTLNEITDRLLAKIWQDPRKHYVLMTSAVSGPTLNFALDPNNLDAQLELAAKFFINGPYGVGYDEDKDELILPTVYQDKAKDFGEDEMALRSHIKAYVEDERLAKRFDDETIALSYREYDWTLNDAAMLQ